MNRKRDRRYRKLRAAILAESDICYICGKPGANSVDHVVPIAKGGKNTRENMKPAHMFPCNRSKGTRDYAPIVRRSGALD